MVKLHELRDIIPILKPEAHMGHDFGHDEEEENRYLIVKGITTGDFVVVGMVRNPTESLADVMFAYVVDHDHEFIIDYIRNIMHLLVGESFWDLHAPFPLKDFKLSNVMTPKSLNTYVTIIVEGGKLCKPMKKQMTLEDSFQKGPAIHVSTVVYVINDEKGNPLRD